MKLPFSGNCLCHAVQIQSNAEPLAMYNCHCNACQKIHGAPYAPLLVLSASMTSITGRVADAPCRVNGDAHAKRLVCAACGMPVLAFADPQSKIVLINAMMLDDTHWYVPVADIWTEHVQPWVVLDRHIPKVFKSPPLLGGEVV